MPVTTTTTTPAKAAPAAPTTPVAATSVATASASPSSTYLLPGESPNAAGTGTIFNLPTGTQSFSYPALPSNASGPNSPNFTKDQTTAAGSGGAANLGLIIGITIGGVAVLAIAGLLLQRYRAQSRTNTINSHQSRSRNKTQPTGMSSAPSGAAAAAATATTAATAEGYTSGGDEERGDKAKLAKSFTIRKPPSVYVEDDMDLDQTGHPRYKSASDALNHPYYGERTPGLIEYELSDTSGQKYGPSSVAERKRYVEQQQRMVMDEYEMYNSNRDDMVSPSSAPSPYPPSLNAGPVPSSLAPSYTSGPLSPVMTPSLGGRSPRVHHNPSQSPTPMPLTRPMPQQFDSNEYRY